MEDLSDFVIACNMDLDLINITIMMICRFTRCHIVTARQQSAIFGFIDVDLPEKKHVGVALLRYCFG